MNFVSSFSVVRKCGGKDKDKCLQSVLHPNSRWECSFETNDKEEFLRHVKNVYRRNRWRDQITSIEPDSNGFYHCVYFSTDRHHVENHYTKSSPEHQLLQHIKENQVNSMPNKKWNNNANFGVDEGNISQININQIKKPRLNEEYCEQDKSLQVNRFPDNIKTEDLINNIEKKLEIPREMCQSALEKLHKQGFIIVSVLKTLTKEGWMRLELPLAIEEELKNQIYGRNYPQYVTVPMWAQNSSYWNQQITNNFQSPFQIYFDHSQDGSGKTEIITGASVDKLELISDNDLNSAQLDDRERKYDSEEAEYTEEEK